MIEDATRQRWQALVDSFGLTKSGACPWDAELLARNYTGSSHGEKCTISFLLNVWDPGHEWACGKFDVVDALSVWRGSAEHQAFLKWARDPWWP